MWADMAIYHSTPLGLHYDRPRCSQLATNIVGKVGLSEPKIEYNLRKNCVLITIGIKFVPKLYEKQAKDIVL